MTKDSFSSCHPIVNLYYFAVMLISSMFLTHPVMLLISLLCACTYCTLQRGFQNGVWKKMKLLLPLAAAVICINMLFNHYGITVLGYLPGGNALTLEAAVYGLVMAVMLAEVLLWFSCWNEVMTSDKFVYLFGRILPGLSLILTMCFRFVPCFGRQAKKILQAQKGIGRDPMEGSLMQRMRKMLTGFSILVTWGLENGIDTADSMIARGYGLKGRSAFSLFRMDKRDCRLLAGMTALLFVQLAGIWNGYADVLYNPEIIISGFPLTGSVLLFYLSYLVFGLLPIWLDRYEKRKWKSQYTQVQKAGQKGVRLWEL